MFFRGVALEGGYAAPILYALFWQFLAGILGFVVGFVPGATTLGAGGRLLWVFVGPPLTLLVGFLLSGVFFVVWHLLGSPHDFRTAFRCWALLSPLAALGALSRFIPYLFLAVAAYGFFLLVVASVEVHGVPPRKAWTAWGVLFALFFALQIVAVVFNNVRGRLASGGVSGMGAGAPPSAPRFPGQAMMPPEIQKQIAEEMAKHQAAMEKTKKESAPKK